VNREGRNRRVERENEGFFADAKESAIRAWLWVRQTKVGSFLLSHPFPVATAFGFLNILIVNATIGQLPQGGVCAWILATLFALFIDSVVIVLSLAVEAMKR